jgi:hypothetical protein
MLIRDKQYFILRLLCNIIAQCILICLVSLLPKYAAVPVFVLMPITVGITTALVEKRIHKERFGFWIYSLATLLVVVGDALISNWHNVEHDKYNRLLSFWTQVQMALAFGLPLYMFLACTSFAITRKATRTDSKASPNP